MTTVIKYFAIAYIFFISWTGTFTFGSWLRLPFWFLLACLVLAFIDTCFKRTTNMAPYKLEDSLILLFLVFYIFSAIVNPNGHSMKYILAYFFVLIFLYLFLKNILFSYLTSHQIFVVNVYAVTFVGTFLSLNFILNFAGIVDLQGMLPRVKETTALYATTFNRGYGFSTEPGIVAFYLNVLGPLALWYMWNGTKMSYLSKVTSTALIVFGWLVTFSASGWVFLALGFAVAKFLTSILRQDHCFKIRTLFKYGFVCVSIFGAIVLFFSQPINRELVFPMYSKITLSNEMGSSVTRTERWIESLVSAADKPFFGHGAGYYSSNNVGSPLSWYLMLLVENGFFTFFIMISFLGLVLRRMANFHHPSRLAVLTGFLAGCGHLLVISTFFHPFLWLLIAIFYAQQTHYFKLVSLNMMIK